MNFPKSLLLKVAGQKSRWIALVYLIIGVLLSSQSLQAQGWEIYFGGNAEDIGYDILQTQDHGYLLTGYSESFGDHDLSIYLVRTDVDGKEIWSKTYDPGFWEFGYSTVESADKGFLVTGQAQLTPFSDFDVYLLKVGEKGDSLWSKSYGSTGYDAGYRIIKTVNSAGYLITGETENNGQEDVLLIKIDNDGNVIWTKTYGTAGDDEGRGMLEVNDGYLILGSAINPANGTSDLYLLKVDFDGNEAWSRFYGSNGFDEGYDLTATADGNVALVGHSELSDVYLIKVTAADGDVIWSTTFGGDFGDIGYDILRASNGDLVVTGITEIDPTNSDAFLARFDNDGNQLWWNNVGRGSHVDNGQAAVQTADKGFAVVGYNSLASGVFINDVTLIKTGPTGLVYTNHLAGKVFIDDNDCTFQPGEQGLQDWLIKAESPGKTFFGTTDANGNYDITLDSGEYEVSVLVKNDYWEACIAVYSVNFPSLYDTLVRNFPMLPVVECPLLSVDVSTPAAQDCSNIGYTVSYSNTGTISATAATVHIVLDADLSLNTASIPFTFIPDSLYVFNIGDVGVDENGSFFFTATSDCNGTPAQAYSVSSHIFPDSICLPLSPNWDLSSISVDGYCDIDSILFSIHNNGIGSMQQPQEFIVIEDDILAREGNYILSVGMDTVITLPATGATYRLIAEQADGHPGNDYPTVAVEGCTTSPGNFSTGYVTMFQENENDPFQSIDVQENISSTDYIFMRGYPKGYQKNGDNLIPANTSIEYHIFFQNAGTDTVNRLVIRDTLPLTLDPGSIAAGASSHPYDVELYGNGVLKFTFENMLLVPGGGAASQGFIKFKVSQKPNLPAETEIQNSAAVFLGYDAPVQTAVYEHVVCDSFFNGCVEVVSDKEPPLPGVEISAYPNPFADAIEFEVEGLRFNTLTISLFDINGQLVRRENVSGNQLRLRRGDLPSGAYPWQLEGDGRLLGTGKIIVR